MRKPPAGWVRSESSAHETVIDPFEIDESMRPFEGGRVGERLAVDRDAVVEVQKLLSTSERVRVSRSPTTIR